MLGLELLPRLRVCFWPRPHVLSPQPGQQLGATVLLHIVTTTTAVTVTATATVTVTATATVAVFATAAVTIATAINGHLREYVCLCC